jgi:hypothetical protein
VTTITDKAFWIDTEYDKDRASDGISRYGAYVRQHIGDFAECWDGTWEDALPVHFAAHAWRVATSPIMAPGYVRKHPRVLAASLEHSYWDGSLVASVELITPWPRALVESGEWMQRTGKGWWHGWPEERIGGLGYYFPSDEDISHRPYLMAKASLCFTVPDGQLPHPPADQPVEYELEDLARQSVAVLVTELNRIVEPVIQTLESSTTRSRG